MFDNQLAKTIIAGLQGHPEAVLAFAMTLVAAGLLVSGFGLFLSAALPAGFYLLYQFRMMRYDKHRERLAEIEVRRIETEVGIPSRRRNMEKVKESKPADQGSREKGI